MARKTCADCGTNKTNVAYLPWNGTFICEHCWMRGSYGRNA